MAITFGDLSPARKYLCGLCIKILREPMQTPCGHRYCKSCIHQLLARDDGPLCKPCKEDGNGDSILTKERIYPDRAILRELNGLEIQCQNDGCKWQGNYKEYNKNHATSCAFELINCDNSGCIKKVKRHSLLEHLTSECVMRVIKCQYCKDDVMYKDLKSHYKQCNKYPVKCQYCDKHNIPREKLTQHQDIQNGDCPKKMVLCNFSTIGCDKMVAMEKTGDHNRQHVTKHMSMLLHAVLPVHTSMQQYKDSQREIAHLGSVTQKHEHSLSELTSNTQSLQTQIQHIANTSDRLQIDASLQNKIEEHGKESDRLRNRHKVLETKLMTYEGIVAVLNNQIEQDGNTIENLQRQGKLDKELFQSLERKIKSQDRIIALKDVALAEQDLRIQSLEMASYDGMLVWKIPNFNKKRQDAISGIHLSIYSPCFYSSRHGYKMCARIYLNGDGMGKGNHVSLFFVIMKGPFDALLRWPFRQKVTLMWLDQNNRDHVIDAFRPDPTSSSFKRPAQDMNVASGCPLFMPLSQIDSARHAYVKDDVAFIRIIVDTTDIA
ncbi:TNF receptor-associated factor 2-like isoform X2 [Glandiceps talaboti]